MWLDSISKIYIVNLQKRVDRLLETAQLMEDYEIPYTVFPAIERENGAEGLRDTMNLLLQTIVENGYANTLVFEDDVKFIEDKFWFHDTMNNAMSQLPENYHLLYLGGQPTAGYSHFYSANLLPAIKYFATQSVIYSLQGAIEILAMKMDFPIDNWIVNELQPYNRCYAIHPILCSQRAGFSDIGGNYMDWHPFIEPRHNQKVIEITKKW
jgi:GR25 family glycosyltransferase involved in LPS biosynthesis